MRIEWIEKYMTEAEKQISESGEVEQGVQALDQLLYEEHGYASLHNHIGWAHLYYTHDLARAELHLITAIRFEPDFHPPYQHLGALYVRQGRYGEAIQVLRDGLTKPDANKYRVLDLIGQAHEMRTEFKLAIEAYREAMETTVVTMEVDALSMNTKRCNKKRWSSIVDARKLI